MFEDPENASSSSKEMNIVQVPSTMTSPHAPSESLESLKVSGLKERLRQYGLKLSGKKAELQARLKEFTSLHHHQERPPTTNNKQEQTNLPDERKLLQSIENLNSTTTHPL